MLDQLPFARVVAVDFEFEFGGHDSKEAAGRSGERPRPICMVARELRSGQQWRVWRGEFESQPPFPIDDGTVLVAYYASAELGCFRALDWHPPKYVLDLFTEFRARINGVQGGARLVNAAAYFGLDAISVEEKSGMVELILRGGPWTEAERAAILDYCESDVALLAHLLPAMLPRIDLPRALLRGRFMRAAAIIEWNGIPIDAETLALLRQHWDAIKDGLIAEIDRDYGVFEGRSFRREKWRQWLIARNIPLPLLASGQLDLSDDAFRELAKAYPMVSPLRELRHALSEMRLSDLAVGSDSRNRTILSAFRSRTGRCQPSNTKYIFGPSVWLRALIKPPPGWGVAYLDWSQQEFAIAAVLSADKAMLAAYQSGDSYLGFCIQAGLVTDQTPEAEREDKRQLGKQCVLGVAYGMGAEGLARRIDRPPIVARDWSRTHRETFPDFWRWSDAQVDRAMLGFPLLTTFGWPIRIGRDPNPRSLRNFPCQANGAEMLRLAACLATERGIEVCATIHDAMLIAAPLDRIDHDVELMRAVMTEASRVVLAGFEVRVDTKVIRYPERYQDKKRGLVMWERVMKLLAGQELKRKGVA